MDIPEYNPTKLAASAGRMKMEKFIETRYPEFYRFLMENEKYSGLDIKERMYWYFNGISEHPVCKTCGKPTKFHGPDKGYAEHCCCRCTQLDKKVRDKNKTTVIETYGENYTELFVERGKQTKLRRHGDENYNNTEKATNTCLERYGVDNPMKCDKFKMKSKETCLMKYGSEYYFSSEEALSRRKEFSEKRKTTNTTEYGYPYATQNPDVKKRLSETVMREYGVPWSCLREEAHHRKLESNESMKFAKLLEDRGIEYSKEFRIEDRTFDFKVGNTLIEINPSITHNINYNPFNRNGSKKNLVSDKLYHKKKSELASRNGFHCIHVWDWDNIEIIADMVSEKKKLYARECTISEVDKKSADEFLIENHIQGTCRGQKIRIGLYSEGELIELMTFGKPRYNKSFQWELLRLCTRRRYYVVGGAERIFKRFISSYDPESVISYCDMSKFSGDVYNRLGMTRISGREPSMHWSSTDGNIHYTNNILNNLGADKLIGTSYGKGTSNKNIMLENGFVQVYDCGQAGFAYNRYSDKSNHIAD